MRRGAVLTTLAALFVLLALSDISKPLSEGRAGLVFLGTETTGLANAIIVLAFGIFLLIYASGIGGEGAGRCGWSLDLCIALGVSLGSAIL
jgi:hypothetical protein